jgi:hypothetical protein
MAWSPAHQVGDRDPLIPGAKRALRIYSYGKAEGLGTTDTSDVYTEGFGRALVKYKTAVKSLVEHGQRIGPITDTDPEFDWATKVQMLLVPRSNVPAPANIPDKSHLPLFISTEGHMSDMFIGPAVGVGQQLEREGLVQLQPTGYNNTTIPFDNESGVQMICSFFRDPRLMWVGRYWFTADFSQGNIVGSQFFMRYVLPPGAEFHAHLRFWLGTIACGAPYRPKDVVAEWIPDPPKAGTQGISGQRMPVGPHLAKIKYVCRHGDLYAENEDNHVGEVKTTVYDLVQGDPKGILFELLAVGIKPTTEILVIIQAIMSGGLFLFNMGPHGTYDMGPAVDWARTQVLSVNVA